MASGIEGGQRDRMQDDVYLVFPIMQSINSISVIDHIKLNLSCYSNMHPVRVPSICNTGVSRCLQPHPRTGSSVHVCTILSERACGELPQ